MKKNKLIKTLTIIAIILGLIILITCGANIIYRINKPLEKQMITEEQAIQSAKEITENLGKTFGNVNSIKLTNYTSKGEIWSIVTNNSLSIDIHAYTGKLSSIFDNSVDYTKIPSKTSREEAEKLLKQVYLDLGYQEEEYELESLEKGQITDDANYWKADFCKKYDGIYNKFQCIRIGIIPEVNHLYTLVIFDYDFENNKVVIEKDEATEIARNKAKELNKKQEIEKIETNLDIVEVKGNTTRKAWVVGITYEQDMYEDRVSYFVDATTGEIIGSSQLL